MSSVWSVAPRLPQARSADQDSIVCSSRVAGTGCVTLGSVAGFASLLDDRQQLCRSSPCEHLLMAPQQECLFAAYAVFTVAPAAIKLSARTKMRESRFITGT